MKINFFYYLSKFSYNELLPSLYFRFRYKQLKEFEKKCNQVVLEERLNYYFKIKRNFKISENAVRVKHYKRAGMTGYFLDLKEFLHYFKADFQFDYRFGDDLTIYPTPVLIKARPISANNENSIIFKLNKRRHFQWVDDKYCFEDKKNMLVWRGGVYQTNRKVFVEKFWNHPLCDVGQTNKLKEDVPWIKSFMSVKEQLQYKFICCPEGNDVATNLKWVMSSNSLCLMPKPTCETWFMEGELVAGKHYVEIESDFSDLEEKITYYSTNIDEAKEIIANAHEYVKRFQNPIFEDLLCLKVLEKYAEMTGQSEMIKF